MVDDCSTDKEIVDIAKNSKCIYLKTPYNSGTDSLPFNMGVQFAKGDYICRVDSDDLLLSLPDKMPCDIFFGNINRVKAPFDISVEELILAPRAIMSSSTIKKELWLKYPYIEGSKIYTDILCALRMLYNNHSFNVSTSINYIYRKRKPSRESSIQSSKSNFTHRLTHIQTVSQFCIDEDISDKESIKYIQLAVMNLKYGSKSRRYLKK